MALPSQAVREAEADKVTQAFQLALAQQGAETVVDALTLWQGTPVDQTATTVAAWSEAAIRMILLRRGQSRALALAWYRLVRALRTGRTVADTSRPEPSYVTLQKLRFEFEQLRRGRELPESSTTPELVPKDERIPVDDIIDTEQRGKDLDEDATGAAEESLKATGPDSLQKAIDKVDPEQPHKDADAEKKSAHSAAGARQAAAASRHVQNGARSITRDIAQQDKLAIGFVRVSLTGTPCGFCAMLISRGEIFYSSRSSASGKTVDADSVTAALEDGISDGAKAGDAYHDNCNCVAEPVFSKSQYANGPQYALNREFSKAWPEVTKGLYGKDALNAWRSYMRRRNADLTASQSQAA